MEDIPEESTKKLELPLKEALFLGFCAVFILFTRAALRLHLGIPGHAMFFTDESLFLSLTREPGPRLQRSEVRLVPVGYMFVMNYYAGWLQQRLGVE